MRGGLWLAGRDSLGTLIRLGGVIVLTSLLGPAGFGIYAGGVAVVIFLATVAQLSIEVHLVKHEGPLTSRQLGTAYTCLLVASTTVVALGLLALLVTSRSGVDVPDHAVVALLLASIPVNVLWAPAQACLEREYAYRQLGAVELIGDVILYATSILLVGAGGGPAGAAAGYLVWQVWLLVASHVVARRWPVFALDRGHLRSMLGFGAVVTLGGAFERARLLVNPLIVGPLLGAVAVGQVALAMRIIETLSVINRAARRLSFVTLSAARQDVPRLRQALQEGGALVVAGTAVPLALACVAAPIGIPLLFGEEWSDAAGVLSLLAVASILGAGFVLPSSLLVVTGAQRLVSLAAAARLALLVATTFLLVPVLGEVGYGAASVCMLLGNVGLAVAVRRRIGRLPAREMSVWMAAFTPLAATPLVTPWLAPVLWLPLLGLLSLPSTRASLLSAPLMLRTQLRTQTSRRRAAPAAPVASRPS